MGLNYTGTGPDPDPSLSKNPLADIGTLSLDTDIEAVVLGYDPDFHYNKLVKASNYLKHEGCRYIAANKDSHCMVEGRIFPGTGAMVGKSDIKFLFSEVLSKSHRPLIVY